MALFADDRVAARPQGRGIRRRGVRRLGWFLVVAAILGAFVFALVPAPYVIEQPGPVFNTLGKVTVDDKQVPMIEIPSQKTYTTSGALDMLTVNVLGNREQSPSWFEVAQAWADPSKAVVPIDAIYPVGTTVEESDKQSEVDMQNSQKDAVAAALRTLGYTLPSTLVVGALSPKSPSKNILKTGDTVLSVNGESADTVEGLRDIIAKTGAGTPVSIDIERDGEKQTVSVTPQLSDDANPVPIIGIYPAVTYTYPFDVKIQLQNVGGPSAGQMFALGIIDKLTPGELNGGAKVAGTGTIDADGNIGAIGGIRQKMYGARASGATYFLAPSTNCNEVKGHVPSGIRVFAVKTLTDSMAALTAIKSGSGLSSLPTCDAVSASR